MPRSRKSGGVWKGTLTFGLLNIPVSLQTAQEDQELHFTLLDEKNHSKIHYKKIDEKTGREVPPDRIVKGYEYKKGQFVIMSDEDFDQANVKATQSIDIQDFVALDQIDLMMFEKPYYLVPRDEGVKGYFLLRDALLKTGKVAIAKVVLRSKQHLCAVLPKDDYLILETLRFAHTLKETHEVDFLKDLKRPPKPTERELQMAKDLIESMSSDWAPDKYRDTYYEDVMKLIRQKIEKGEDYIAPETEKPEEIAPTAATDLLPLLRRSLEAKRSQKSSSKNQH